MGDNREPRQNIDYHNCRRYNLWRTIQYNYLLFFYPLLLMTAVLLWLRRHELALDWDLIHLVEALFLAPLVFALLIGPALALLAAALKDSPFPTVANGLNALLLPVSIPCVTLIFVGSVCNFFVTMSWPHLRYEENPELFRWNCYIFLIDQEDGDISF